MFTTALTAATALFASASLAAPAPMLTRDSTLSAPFNLSVTSTSSQKYIGALLGAAHSGAAIEALAVDGFPTSFSFNATSLAPVSGGFGSPGYIVYTLNAVPNPDNQELNFLKNDTSNVNAAFFGTGNGPELFTFEEESGKAFGELFKYNNADEADAYFYVCPQSLLGYTYETLSYVAQGAKPDNEECDQVTVKKIEL